MQVTLICQLSFKGSRLRVNPNALWSFCLKVFLNHVPRTKFMVVLAPQGSFSFVHQSNSLEIAPFLSREGANQPQAPVTPQGYRRHQISKPYQAIVKSLALFSVEWHSVSAPQNSRVPLRFFGKCFREEGEEGRLRGWAKTLPCLNSSYNIAPLPSVLRVNSA